MNAPQVVVIPARSAVCLDADVTLDVLVQITPSLPEVHFVRPPLNLALVLDRSGSMDGARKMEYARRAAVFVVEQLLPTDRISVTIFDDHVETIVPATLAVNKRTIVDRINATVPYGSTDLHGGWRQGAAQAETGLVAGGINRVLLLSDGRANVGVTDPNTIAAEARGLTAHGVSTTTLGVGDDYNEDLMETLAKAGDGNYYFIETPSQLQDLFQTELHGLMATSGQKVSLGLEPGDGVKVVDVLNDFDTLANGRRQLPNLIAGMPIAVVVRLNVPARRMSGTLLNVRLAWDAPRGSERLVLRERLGGLPAVPMADWQALPIDPVVSEHQALLMAARAQREASRAHERGDLDTTAQWLTLSEQVLCTVASHSIAATQEMAASSDLRAALDANESGVFRKLAKYRSHLRQHGRSDKQPRPPAADESK